jgi:enamine deaminase RidA (YjgF/YER057c/UK114 family)
MAVPFLGTGRKLLTISGTASISPEGETLHNGDALAQLDESLRVIAALLDSRQASFRDVVQAVLYCPLEMAPDLYLRAARLGFPVDRMIVQPGILCRPDLACEIEAMAVIGA